MPGSIDADGIIRNSLRMRIGNIDSNDTVYNAYTSVGKIESDGTIKNSMQIPVGKVEDDGTVCGQSITAIGKVENDGTICDGNMVIIGRLANVEKTWAAVPFFFFDFDMS
jgi:hypothetical protein